ncbi:hypothetical protein KKB18_07465 [bacterium]|nr:hypothetical protein [bacterium]
MSKSATIIEAIKSWAPILTFLSGWLINSFINWYRSRAPVDFGLSEDNKLTKRKNVSRNPVTPITFIFKNKTKKRLTNLIFDVQIWRPLRLSDTNHAFESFAKEGSTKIYKRDMQVYQLRHCIELGPKETKTPSIELHTQDNKPDIYPIDINFSSKEYNGKNKRCKIHVI